MLHQFLVKRLVIVLVETGLIHSGWLALRLLLLEWARWMQTGLAILVLWHKLVETGLAVLIAFVVGLARLTILLQLLVMQNCRENRLLLRLKTPVVDEFSLRVGLHCH